MTRASAAGVSPAQERPDPQPRRAWVRHALVGGFLVVVLGLLLSHARAIDWHEVFDAVLDYPPTVLWQAAALVALSHCIYSSYDLLGRAWIGHALPARKVMAVTFVSYAFNLNLGPLVGAFGFRYRLYSRLGLPNHAITRILGLSLVTNWLGYLVLAGGAFTLGIITPPAGWRIGAGLLQALGIALMAVAASYVLLCAVPRRREFTLGGHRLALPPARLAALQIGVSCANWLTIGGVLFVLLQFRLPYPLVLGVLLMAAVAGVIAHIPAGLGVLEAVFIALLGSQLPQRDLLAALLVYRALYYLAPLALATVAYLSLEAGAKRTRAGEAMAASRSKAPSRD